MKKRLLALLLAFSMVFSTAAPALAEESLLSSPEQIAVHTAEEKQPAVDEVPAAEEETPAENTPAPQKEAPTQEEELPAEEGSAPQEEAAAEESPKP